MTIALTVIVIFIIANIGRLTYQNLQVPNLGVENGQLKPISNKPNNVSTQTDVDDKKIAPLATKATQEDTMKAIKHAVQGYGGATIQTETSDYLYIIFTTPRMKFKDDAEFWIDMDSKQVHFRSASRAGYSDLGLNRKRFDALRELYQTF